MRILSVNIMAMRQIAAVFRLESMIRLFSCLNPTVPGSGQKCRPMTANATLKLCLLVNERIRK